MFNNNAWAGWLEYTAFAETLSDIDAEISALEEKLVKAGMMSELLSGKIRLVTV
jgi:hypothetical protein